MTSFRQSKSLQFVCITCATRLDWPYPKYIYFVLNCNLRWEDRKVSHFINGNKQLNFRWWYKRTKVEQTLHSKVETIYMNCVTKREWNGGYVCHFFILLNCHIWNCDLFNFELHAVSIKIIGLRFTFKFIYRRRNLSNFILLPDLVK